MRSNDAQKQLTQTSLKGSRLVMVDVSCRDTSNHIIQLSFTVQLVMSCPHCKKTLTTTSSLTRHLPEKHEHNTTRIQCDLCQKSFARPEHCRRHVHVVHKQAFKSQTSLCHSIDSKGFHFLMHPEPNSEDNVNMDLPTNQAHLQPNSEDNVNMDLPTNQAHLQPNSEDNVNMELPTNQAHLQPKSTGTINMDLPTTQTHQMPMEQMIFDDGSGQLDHNGHIDPDLLLVDPELFALLTRFFNNISSWEVCYIMLHL